MSACERVVGLTVREASQGDAAAIAGVHVRAWRVAYRSLLPDDLLDRLSVEDREESWRGILGDAGDESFTLIAIDGERQLVGFCAVAAPARDVDAGEQTAEVAATYVDPHRWRAGIGSDLLAAAVSRLREGVLAACSAVGVRRERIARAPSIRRSDSSPTALRRGTSGRVARPQFASGSPLSDQLRRVGTVAWPIGSGVAECPSAMGSLLRCAAIEDGSDEGGLGRGIGLPVINMPGG